MKYNVIRNKDYDFINENYSDLYPNIHKYPATMLPQIGVKILHELNISNGILLDPYCGSGSSFSSALECGINYMAGYDINPLAVLISKVKFTKISLNSLAKEREHLYNEIINLNSKAVAAYTQPIINGMSDLIHGGAVFKSRDYLTIDGDDGLIKKLDELDLSTNDRKTIKSDVEFTGANRINNHLDAWCKEAEDDVKSVYVTMSDQIKKLLDSTVGSLSGTAAENETYAKYSPELLKLFKNHTELINELVGKSDNEILKQIQVWAREKDKYGKTLIENPANNLRAEYARELKNAGIINLSAETFRRKL